MLCPVCDCPVSVTPKLSHRAVSEYEFCRQCRTAFIPPDRVSEVPYDRTYYAPWETGEHGMELTRRSKTMTFRAWLSALEHWCSPGRLLDVGCAMGFFLAVAADQGWTGCGIEVSEYAAAVAATDGRFSVHRGTLQDHPYGCQTFDAVSMFDVLEHLDVPRAALTMVRDLLKPDGVLIMSTPDLDSWSSGILGERWPQRKPEHRFLFSHRSIRRLLRDTGFRLLRIRPAVKWLTAEFLLSYARAYAPPVLAQGFSRAYDLGLRRAGRIPFPIVTGEMLVIARRVR